MKRTVEIFSTPVCHFCQIAKEYMTREGVEFTNHDVTKDMVKRQELIDLGAMGVPLIRITGEGLSEPIILNGFGDEEEDALSKAMSVGKYKSA